MIKNSQEGIMTDTSTIYERLNEIFRDIFDDDDLTLSPETTAQDVEGWDSMTNVQIMLSVEREFGLHLSAGQMAALRNVGDLVDTIAKARA
jgi:acyl carrier protein